jgi:hypothetical protein
MAYLKVYPNSRVKPESVYLQKYKNNVTSQCGEDGIIEKILDTIGETNKWCVELGAWNGKHFSNSWSLINMHGWSAVLIEGENKKFLELDQLYSENSNVYTVNTFVDIYNDDNSLDTILSGTPIPEYFDFLCIDIDGCDWHIWDSLDNYHPRIVLIEFNPTIPNNVYFVQDKNIKINHGSSLRAMIELGKNKGYELVATTEWNAFFVRREDFSKFDITDNSIDSMHTLGGAESIFFQLYDGSVFLCGCTTLLWCNKTITFDDIQVLPKEQRKYRA